MTINMNISIRTEIYSKAAVFDTDTMYFHQEMKENDVIKFYKAVQR